MFVPDVYQPRLAAWMTNLMRENPLSLLVSAAPGENEVPFATHLPIVEDPVSPLRDENLEGSVLVGHLNRQNPHWRLLAAGPTKSLLVFSGPNTYVSPVIYDTSPAAPTWNYTSVHVSGTVIPDDDPEFTLHVVRSTVAAYEARFGLGWDMSESLPHFRRILPGVGAFRFNVDYADGMAKLSQEQRPEVQARMCTHFTAQKSEQQQRIARLMQSNEL